MYSGSSISGRELSSLKASQLDNQSKPYSNPNQLIGDKILTIDVANTNLMAEWSRFAIYALPLVTIFIAATSTSALSSTSARIAEVGGFSAQLFDPSKFQPVCPASDSLYQVMKGVSNTLIGAENVIEYGPLVASVLLRVRLELCVFESFIYEAVIPFIQQKGISWIFPLHETLETFLAGTIFAVASNFILLGSTKVITVLLIYIDALFGIPVRVIGALLSKFNSLPGKVGNVLKFSGEAFGAIRRSIEAIDTFVGRYLVFGTTAYVLLKFLHYKVFSNFPPF
jgi:hypothetical protein